jgi:hypothetical protein
MTFAHVSVGTAATSPTSGTAFNPLEPTRHGAATTPQPQRPRHSKAKIAGFTAAASEDDLMRSEQFNIDFITARPQVTRS